MLERGTRRWAPGQEGSASLHPQKGRRVTTVWMGKSLREKLKRRCAGRKLLARGRRAVANGKVVTKWSPGGRVGAMEGAAGYRRCGRRASL